MKYNEVNKLLQGGAPALKFPTFGTTAMGTIINAEVSAQTDLQRNVRTFKDGNVMQQVVLTLQTEERDPANANDDGVRRLFVKGHMLVALRQALAAKKVELEDGGTVVVRYVSDKPSETVGFKPAKQFEVAYEPPAASPEDATAIATSTEDSGNLEDLLKGSVLPQ